MDIRPLDPRRSEDVQADNPLPVQRRRELPELTSAHASQLNQDAIAFVQNQKPRDGGVIYLGMNSIRGQNTREAANLVGPKTVIGHSEDGVDGADHIHVDDREVDLATAEGVRAFAASLGLPKAETDAIANVVRRANAEIGR